MKVKSLAVMFGLATLPCVGSTVTVDLTSDRTIDVASGTTTTVTRLTGGAHTLTKTGAGTLRIEAAYNRAAKIVVKAGALQTGIPARPACLADTWFHVDATVLSSMTTSVSGDRTLVSEWRDADGGSVKAATLSSTYIKRPSPYLLPRGQNGRTLVDFGSLYNGQTATSGYGGCLKWSETCWRPAEMFVVVADTEDSKAVVIDGKGGGIYYRNTPILGTSGTDSHIAPLIRNNPATGANGDRHSPLLLSGAGFGSSYAKATFAVDGTSVTPTTYEMTDGVHLVSIYGIDFTALDAKPDDAITKAAYAFDAFATDRNNCFGGQRLGEVVILTDVLTAAERMAVNDYLTAKWMPLTLANLELGDNTALEMPDGGQVVVPSVRQGSGVTVSGTGELVCDLIRSGSSIEVRNGTYDADVLRDEGSWFHVDASATNTCTIETLNGTNFVARWNDVNGGSVYAKTGTNTHVWYKTMTGGTEIRKPYLEQDAASGLNLMNFGSLANCTDGYGKEIAHSGWGAALIWSADCTTARDILMVCADTEDSTNSVVEGKYGAPAWRCQALLGGPGTAFVRGNPKKGEAYSPLVLSADVSYCGAKFAVDGTVVDGTTFCPSEGLHLFSIYDVPSAKIGVDASKLNAFACERYYEHGGQRIAEVLVFTNALDATTRARLSSALQAKWLGAAMPTVEHERLTVATGAVLRLPWQNAVVTDTLTVAGRLETSKVSTTHLAVANVGGVIDGTLDLGTSGGTVDLTGFPARDYRRTKVKILAASATEGSASGWNAIGLTRGSATLALETDGLYATFAPPGFSIIVH